MATHEVDGQVYTDAEFIDTLSTIGDDWRSKLRRGLWHTPRRRIGHALAMPRHWYERARYGYSHRDVWEMGHHLATVALGMTVEMQAHMHGYPTDLTEQEWFDRLSTMERGWMAAIALLEGDIEDKDHRELEMRYFREGMAEFTDRFFHLWD